MGSGYPRQQLTSPARRCLLSSVITCWSWEWWVPFVSSPSYQPLSSSSLFSLTMYIIVCIFIVSGSSLSDVQTQISTNWSPLNTCSSSFIFCEVIIQMFMSMWGTVKLIIRQLLRNYSNPNHDTAEVLFFLVIPAKHDFTTT